MRKKKPDNKQLSIKQNMVWNSAGSIFSLGCQWLISVVVVRLSGGYDAAGVYALATSVYGIFSPIAAYRMYTYQVSDVSHENTTGEYFAFRVLTSLMALVLTVGYAFFTCRPETLMAIALFSVFKISALLIDVFHATDQQNHRMDYIGQSLALQGLVSLVLFIAVFSASHSLELTFIVMTAAVLLIAVFFDYPRTHTLAEIHPHISIKKARRLLIRCLPAVVAGIACSAAASFPRQFLSFALGDTALGIYASVAAPVAIIQMGASYIYNPLLGYFSEYYDRHDTNSYRKLFIKAAVAIAVIGAVCSVGLGLLGKPLLVFVYGESIASYAYLFGPLIACAVITGFMWFINDLLMALRNFRATLIGALVALAVSVCLMIPSITAFDLNGVTITTTASCVAAIVYMCACLFRQLRAHFSPQE